MVREMYKTRAWNPCSKLLLQPLNNRNAYLKIPESIYSICPLTTETADWPNDDRVSIPRRRGSIFISGPNVPSMGPVPHLAHHGFDTFESFRGTYTQQQNTQLDLKK